jgi:hypothetical protein
MSIQGIIGRIASYKISPTVFEIALSKLNGGAIDKTWPFFEQFGLGNIFDQ